MKPAFLLVIAAFTLRPVGQIPGSNPPGQYPGRFPGGGSGESRRLAAPRNSNPAGSPPASRPRPISGVVRKAGC